MPTATPPTRHHFAAVPAMPGTASLERRASSANPVPASFSQSLQLSHVQSCIHDQSTDVKPGGSLSYIQRRHSAATPRRTSHSPLRHMQNASSFYIEPVARTCAEGMAVPNSPKTCIARSVASSTACLRSPTPPSSVAPHLLRGGSCLPSVLVSECSLSLTPTP